MSQDDFDSISVDFSSMVSSTGTWDPYYGAVPPSITISPNTWTTTGTSGSWTISDSQLTSPNSGKLRLEGENADIEINGRSLSQVLDSIEQRLGLLKCREDLESEWEELKALGDQYRAKLAEIEDKQKMWNTLKR